MSAGGSPKNDKVAALKKKLAAERLTKQTRSGYRALAVAVVLTLVVCVSSVWYLYSPPNTGELEYVDDDIADSGVGGDLTIQQRLKLKRKEEAAAKRKETREKRKERERVNKEKESAKKKEGKKKGEVDGVKSKEAVKESVVKGDGSGGDTTGTFSVTVEQNGIEISSVPEDVDFKKLLEIEDEEDALASLYPENKWLGDDDIAQLANGVTCDLPILSALGKDGDIDPDFEVPPYLIDKYPYIIRDFTLDWPARNDDNWQYYKFLERFGNRSIPSDAGNSYVSGGGGSDTSYPLSMLLENMRKPKKGNDEAFTFDPGIMEHIPELRQDIEVPRWFSSWMTEEHEENKQAWHMLSLAGTRNGLPFHTHGETYMSLIHGRKWWMIYPPGAQPPPETFAITNPVQNVEHYVKHVLPTIQHLPTAPMMEEVIQPADVKGYKPIQCIQEPGDILYLPSSWQHQTLNIGEAIGLGGQASWEPHITLAEKYDMVRDSLKRSPKNLNFHRIQMMTTHSYAEFEQQRLDMSLGPQTSKGMASFKSNYSEDTDWSYETFEYMNEGRVEDPYARERGETHFSSLIMKTEDTWLLLYVPDQPGAGNEAARSTYSSIWDAISHKLKGYISVGFSVVPLDMWSNQAWADEMRLGKEERYNAMEDDEDKPQVFKIKLILGYRDRPKEVLSQAAILKDAIDVNIELVRSNINEICKFSYETMKNTTGTKEGSVSLLTAKIRRLYEESEKHAYEVLKYQPYHPEMIGLLTSTLRNMNKSATHASALEYFEKKFEPLFKNITEDQPAYGMSRVGLASAYHKLAEAGGEVGDLNMSIRILEKSLSLAPGYQKSLADLAMNYILQNNSEKVQEIVTQAASEGMPRTHHKFEMVDMYLKDLERNLSHVWADAAAATDPYIDPVAEQGQGQGLEQQQNGATELSPNPELESTKYPHPPEAGTRYEAEV